MTVHPTRVLAGAAVLVGLSALFSVGACTEAPQTTNDNLARPERLLSRNPIYLDGVNVEVLRAQAEQGDASAQLGLGTRYELGRGVPQDDAEAVLWYRRAAEQGNGFARAALDYLEGIDVEVLRAQADQGDASAQLSLGRRYELGQGVPQDYAEAVVWYRRAAEQGNGFALSALGSQGVPQDYAEALQWDQLGADQGYASAQYILGVRYANGDGVRQDDMEAHMWFNLAAAQSSGEARRIYVEARDDVAERLTAHQLGVAQGRAREWTPTPAP